MLEKLRLLLDIQNAFQDDLLLALIEGSINELKHYCHRDDIENCEDTIIQMCIFKYNQLGNENLKGESYSDIKFDYATDYPDYIVRELKALRKLITF